MKKSRYFSIHSIQALKNNEFSVWIGNVENTPEKLAYAKDLYKEDTWIIELHDYKKEMGWIVK